MRSDHDFIDGQFVPAHAERIAVHNPATGKPVGHVSGADAADAVRAVEAATAAQRAWRRLPAAERGVSLNRFADAIESRAPVMGAVLAQESGKSVADATAEARYAAEILCYHAQWARRIEGEVIPSNSANENLILMREPIGVAARLIPFNFPIYTLLRKIAPALITGNAVVVRPSNNTLCSASRATRASVRCPKRELRTR